jgi:hypothetical protein
MNLEQTSLPFARGGTEHSRHASYTGAIEARKTRGVKTQLYLQWLRRHGPATDHEAVAGTGISLNAINAIRNTLKDSGFIGSAGEVPGVGSAKRARWYVLEGK